MGMGVASAVILIMVSMSFVDAMEKALGTQYDVIQSYDALVYLQGMGATSTAAYARNLNGVKQAEAILEMPYRIRYGDNTADTSVMGLPLCALTELLRQTVCCALPDATAACNAVTGVPCCAGERGVWTF